MHVDYAREFYYRLKNGKNSDPASDYKIMLRLAMDDLVDFAHEIGDEKIKSRCETMQKSSG
jgi:hypothetical protein